MAHLNHQAQCVNKLARGNSLDLRIFVIKEPVALRTSFLSQIVNTAHSYRESHACHAYHGMFKFCCSQNDSPVSSWDRMLRWRLPDTHFRFVVELEKTTVASLAARAATKASVEFDHPRRVFLMAWMTVRCTLQEEGIHENMVIWKQGDHLPVWFLCRVQDHDRGQCRP